VGGAGEAAGKRSIGFHITVFGKDRVAVLFIACVLYIYISALVLLPITILYP